MPDILLVGFLRHKKLCSFQVAEILKDRPSWFRDCRAVDVLNVLPTANGGTIELLYMQVWKIIIYLSCFVDHPTVQLFC